MQRLAGLVIFILVVGAVSFAASRFMPGDWYAALAKPQWTPPNWLFAPVWSALYLMIAITGFMVWDASQAQSSLGVLWGLQLLLNGLWTPLMFGAHAIGGALIDIALLWIAIAAFIVCAWRARQFLAAMLFAPYLAWVSYASALNLAIWRLNP